MPYTFDDELTTDQKLTHLNALILSCDEAIAATAPGGVRSSYLCYVAHLARHESLRLWRELVLVEDELAASKADADDPDPEGDRIQEAWCRRRRLELRIASLHARVRAEERKPKPSLSLIERLIARRLGLDARLAQLHEEATGYPHEKLSHDGDACEGGDCHTQRPCIPCATRLVLQGAFPKAAGNGGMRGGCDSGAEPVPHPAARASREAIQPTIQSMRRRRPARPEAR